MHYIYLRMIIGFYLDTSIPRYPDTSRGSNQ